MIYSRHTVFWGFIPILVGSFALGIGLEIGSASPVDSNQPALTLSIINQWSGDFPVAAIDRLPEGQRDNPAGIISSPEVFSSVWRAFQPGVQIPDIDFRSNLIVFVRNVAFYNRTRIGKVTMTDGVADIVAMETLSAKPIEERVAMALAEIPSSGVRAIRVGDQLIPLRSDPLNTSYLIEDKVVELVDGRNEKETAPGSSSKIITAVLGSPVSGDLNGDGRPDAALILFQNSGGTGTFIYAAAAITQPDGYHGTNTALLGDRISIDQLSIQEGMVIVQYRDRKPNEPMAVEPTVPKSARLIVQDEELKTFRPMGEEAFGLKGERP